jgi:hypothetical protein
MLGGNLSILEEGGSRSLPTYLGGNLRGKPKVSHPECISIYKLHYHTVYLKIDKVLRLT